MRHTIGEQKAADHVKAGACNELDSYMKAQLEDTEDVVAWWGVSNKYVISIMECGAETVQKHSTQYPVLVQMVQDYLPVQGLATLSEHAFLNASLTDSKQCNRLTMDVFEAVQTLKSAYHNEHMSAVAEALSYYETEVMGGQDGDVDQ